MKPIIILLFASLTLWGCGGSSNSGSSEGEKPANKTSNLYTQQFDKNTKLDTLDILVRQDDSIEEDLAKYVPLSLPHPSTDELLRYGENPVVRARLADYPSGQSSYAIADYYVNDGGKENSYKIELEVNANSLAYQESSLRPQNTDSVATYKGYKCVFYPYVRSPAYDGKMTVYVPPFVIVRLNADQNYLRKSMAKILDAMKLEELNQAFNQNPIHYVKPKK